MTRYKSCLGWVDENGEIEVPDTAIAITIITRSEIRWLEPIKEEDR